jgi:hypothetical protein
MGSGGHISGMTKNVNISSFLKFAKLLRKSMNPSVRLAPAPWSVTTAHIFGGVRLANLKKCPK